MDTQTPTPELAAAEPGPDKRILAERTLLELLSLMDSPGTLDIKDGPEGAISIAISLAAELPGLQSGKRSHVLEALQFLLNKLVNRPGTERRWVSLGVGAHPEPRGQRQPPPAASAPQAPLARVVPAAPPQSRSARPPAPAIIREAEEVVPAALATDEVLAAQLKRLAEKCGRLGRFYGLLGMGNEERAQAVAALKGAPGITSKVEGEGRARRVVLVPDKPAPMPKRTLPGLDDNEEMD